MWSRRRWSASGPERSAPRGDPTTRPTWLRDAHAALDAAVAAAYGWPADIADDDALARLFALNQERAAAEQEGK
jgi:hypothetical protein